MYYWNWNWCLGWIVELCNCHINLSELAHLSSHLSSSLIVTRSNKSNFWSWIHQCRMLTGLKANLIRFVKIDFHVWHCVSCKNLRPWESLQHPTVQQKEPQANVWYHNMSYSFSYCRNRVHPPRRTILSVLSVLFLSIHVSHHILSLL